jgi:hypothetical protein
LIFLSFLQKSNFSFTGVILVFDLNRHKDLLSWTWFKTSFRNRLKLSHLIYTRLFSIGIHLLPFNLLRNRLIKCNFELCLLFFLERASLFWIVTKNFFIDFHSHLFWKTWNKLRRGCTRVYKGERNFLCLVLAHLVIDCWILNLFNFLILLEDNMCCIPSILIKFKLIQLLLIKFKLIQLVHEVLCLLMSKFPNVASNLHI